MCFHNHIFFQNLQEKLLYNQLRPLLLLSDFPSHAHSLPLCTVALEWLKGFGHPPKGKLSCKQLHVVGASRDIFMWLRPFHVRLSDCYPSQFRRVSRSTPTSPVLSPTVVTRSPGPRSFCSMKMPCSLWHQKYAGKGERDMRFEMHRAIYYNNNYYY